MLINGSSLNNYPVLSLHIGGEVARVTESIVDPDRLKIIGFRVEGRMVREETGDILPVNSVREFSRMGMIIDSLDELVHEDEVVKIRDVLKLNFALPGLKVVTRKGARLGKVLDYTVEIGGWNIQQIVVQRPFLKSFLDPELIISRKRIVEVNDYQVTVKEEHDRAKSKEVQAEPAEFVPNFVNPFREPDFASDSKAE